MPLFFVHFRHFGPVSTALTLSLNKQKAHLQQRNSASAAHVDECSEKRFRISTNNLHCQKLESLIYILPLIVWVYVCYFSRNYCQNSNPLIPKSECWLKRILTYRLAWDCISPFNKAGLIGNVSEEVATKIDENCRRRQPHYRLTPASRETPVNNPIYTLHF